MRYCIAAVLSGILIAVMIFVNGQLTSNIGNYHATVLIHFIGLALVCFVLLIKRQPPHPGARQNPWMYLGGVIGVCTVVFTNEAVLSLGVSITLALGLLGQLVSSLLNDRFGWFGATIQKFRPYRVLSALLVLIGIMVMMIA